MVSGEGSGSDVVFSESSSAPTVELTLPLTLVESLHGLYCQHHSLYLSPQNDGGDYCIDSVVVRVWTGDEVTGGSGDGGDGDIVLVPILSGSVLRLVLESDLLAPATHYTASLSLYPQTISTNFCE